MAVMENIIIFGASRYGEIAYNVLKKYYNVKAFADNAPSKWNILFCGIKVISPEEITVKDKVIVASQYYYSIGLQLFKMGIMDVKKFIYQGELNKVDDYSKPYQLVDIKEKVLFEGINPDKEKVQMLRENFSCNYDGKGNEKPSGLSFNAAEKKKVLVCAYIFPPLAGSGVQRTQKFVKYLREFGYEPIVVTVGETGAIFQKDEKLINEIPDDIEIIRVDDSFKLPELLDKEEQQQIMNLYYGIVGSMDWVEKYKEAISEQVKNPLLNSLLPDNKMYWVNNVLKTIEQSIDLNGIQLVFTTGGPFSDFVLGYYIKKKYNIPWVADYRDPWTTEESYKTYNYKNRERIFELEHDLEKELVKSMDRIIVLAEHIVLNFNKKYSVPLEKMVTITNGYDSDDFVNLTVEKSDKFTLCYNGAIYIDRNPKILLMLINELIDEGVIDKEKVQWIINGIVDVNRFAELKEADRYNILLYNGYCNHKKSLQYIKNADMLVLFGAAGEAGKFVYTGKVFEYLASLNTIISFSAPDGVLEKLLEYTGCGRNFDYSDKGAIKEYVASLYLKWKNGIEIIQPIKEHVEQYDRYKLTGDLAKVFDKLITEMEGDL